MKKRLLIACLTVIFSVFVLFYASIQKTHSFMLETDDDTAMKSEQIQPVFWTVKVSSDCDTNVVFTDVETGEIYTIVYITTGVSEKIKLKKGKWYTVEGEGNLVVSPVNVRIE